MFDTLLGLASSMNYDTWRSGTSNNPNFMGQNGLWSDAGLNRYFRDYDKSINLDLMRNQYELEKDLSSSAYQRAVADMKAAGLNPAAMAGVNAQQASTPNIGSNYHSGAGSVSHSMNFNSSGFESLFNSILSNDAQAAKIAADELRDNAKFEHKMEEMRESSALAHEYKLKEMRSKYRYENDVNKNPKADYYDEKATELRMKRLGIFK